MPASNVSFLQSEKSFCVLVRAEPCSLYVSERKTLNHTFRCLPISDDTRAFWYVRHFSVLVIHANASSGIGRKEILSRYGIETLNDLPGVGENLREFRHLYTRSSAND